MINSIKKQSIQKSSSHYFVQLLVQNKLLSQEDCNLVLKDSSQLETNIINVLLKANLISLETISAFLLQQLNIDTINLLTTAPDKEVEGFIDFSLMKEVGVLPISFDKNTLLLAMEQPYSTTAVEKAESLFSESWVIKPLFATGMTINEGIDHYLIHSDKPDLLINQLTFGATEQVHIVEKKVVVIKLVESLLIEALNQRASDLHFDQSKYYTQLRLRVDGVLKYTRRLNLETWASVKIRLKVMSQIDITEDRIPQDGSFFCQLRGKNYDFRLSSIPSVYGESIVIRLTSEKSIHSLKELNLPLNTYQCLKSLIKQPSGLILIAGPTGSGKTTTLYSMLQELPLENINVAALEDPIEHVLNGVRQTSVRPDLGMSFAAGIRALLRQDPDVLLIGEIRDSESAKLAIKASLSGHLVLATIHARFIHDIPDRVFDLIGSNDMFYQQTLALMSQRLIRKTCPSCLGEKCQNCNDTGYYGRTILLEVLTFDKQTLNSSIDKQSYKSLDTFAKEAVKQNVTDQKEIDRVFGNDDL